VIIMPSGRFPARIGSGHFAGIVRHNDHGQIYQTLAGMSREMSGPGILRGVRFAFTFLCPRCNIRKEFTAPAAPRPDTAHNARNQRRCGVTFFGNSTAWFSAIALSKHLIRNVRWFFLLSGCVAFHHEFCLY